MSLAARRHALALAALAFLLAAAVAAFLLTRGSEPPPDRAARLVPAAALVYAHLSTDPEREEDQRLGDILGKLPALSGLRGRIEAAISQRAGGFELERDVRPWLGDEAAVALLDSGQEAADALVVLSVRDRAKAEGMLSRVAGSDRGVEHRGVAVRELGAVRGAFVGGFLVIGQDAAVRAAVDLDQGRGEPLSAARGYVAATTERPDERTVDLYASPDGVRRVLRPAAGAAGVLGAFLDNPALAGVGLSAVAEASGLRLYARSARTRAGAAREFEPELLDSVPSDAAGYLGLGGLEAAAGALPPALRERLTAQFREALAGTEGIDLERDVLEPLRGEVALAVSPDLPSPIITLIARTRDEARTREALGRLQGVLGELLAPQGEQAGTVPTFEERRVGDVTAFSLRLTPDLELLYAVFDGRLVVSTAPAGIQRAAEEGAALPDAARFKATVGEPPQKAEAVLFVDLSQLLTLGGQAGLESSTAFQTAREALRSVRALGGVARREENDSTAELFFEIP